MASWPDATARTRRY